MNTELAGRILVKLMELKEDQVFLEISSVQRMAAYKYDYYQNFYPGMHFMESLTRWLSQFKNLEERKIALEFVKKKLIFYSEDEMEHLVSMAFPDFIKPHLMVMAAKDLNCEEYKISKIVNSPEYKKLVRQSLFLSLSDGSRIGQFRRMNRTDFGNEQVCDFYDVTEAKGKDLLKEMNKDLTEWGYINKEDEKRLFKVIVLLEDFSGSGKTLFRWDENKNAYTGKLKKIFDSLTTEGGGLHSITEIQNASIFLVIYMATEGAKQFFQTEVREYFVKNNICFQCIVIHTILEKDAIKEATDLDFYMLQNTYYDGPSLEDSATKVGGNDVKFGFAGCSLPIVLAHNAPNNSVSLLWAYDYANPRGLFPRIKRH